MGLCRLNLSGHKSYIDSNVKWGDLVKWFGHVFKWSLCPVCVRSVGVWEVNALYIWEIKLRVDCLEFLCRLAYSGYCMVRPVWAMDIIWCTATWHNWWVLLFKLFRSGNKLVSNQLSWRGLTSPTIFQLKRLRCVIQMTKTRCLIQICSFFWTTEACRFLIFPIARSNGERCGVNQLYKHWAVLHHVLCY